MKKKTFIWVELLFLLTVLTFIGACSQGKGPKTYDQLRFDSGIQWVQPEISQFTMDNGIHFFCIEDHELPLIKMILKVRTGKVEVAKGKEGLARILAQVMQTGGTANYPEQKFDQLLENRAARFNINMGFDSCTVSLNVMKDDFAFLLPKIVHLLTTPLLPEQKILLAKQMLRTEISRRGEDQATMGIRELKRLIYGPDSVYARLPEYDSVAAVTKRDLQAFHARAFQAPNIQIGLVGDFATEKMQEQLIQAFSHFPGGAEKNTLNFPEIQGSRAQDIQLLSKQNVNQSFVILGHLGSYRDTPDYATLQVMNQIISGGFSGRLFQRVRTQRGLAYSVYGRYGCHYYYPGIFYVALQTKSETTAKAIEVIKRELSKLQKQGVTQDELDQAREQFLNSLIFQYDNPLEILKRRLYYEYRGMDKDSFEKLVQEIQKVSVKDINEVTKKYLGLEDLQVVVVGNKAEVYEQLQALGSVRVTE